MWYEHFKILSESLYNLIQREHIWWVLIACLFQRVIFVSTQMSEKVLF